MAPEERKRPKRPAPEPPQQGQPAEQAQQQGPGPEEQVAQSPAAAKGKAKAKLPELRIRLPKPFETKDGADATEGDFVFIEANLENARGEPYQYVCTWVTDIPVAAMWDDGRILSRRVKLDTSGVDPRNHAVELIVSEWEPEELVEAEPDWYAELEEEEVPDEDEDEPPNDDSAAGYVAGRSLPPIAGAQIGGPPNSRATGLTASRRTTVRVRSRPIGRGDVVPVALRRTQVPPTPDQALWSMIRNSALTWPRYARFMDIVMCGEASTCERRVPTETS